MERDDDRPIRLLLLDDRDSARSQSVARLKQHSLLQIVADVADYEDAARLARELRPDAVLVETRRLDRHGLDAIALLSSLDDGVRPAIVPFLEIIHRADWPGARAAGADDVLLKELTPDRLAVELRRIVDRVQQQPRRPRRTNPDRE